jgi:hypothetical protein
MQGCRGMMSSVEFMCVAALKEELKLIHSRNDEISIIVKEYLTGRIKEMEKNGKLLAFS